MGRKDVLAALVGGEAATTDAANELARDIDWKKVRRVQHGLTRPPDSYAWSRYGSVTDEEFEMAEARSRRALRLAHVLAFLAGVLLGFAFLRGFADEFRLLCAAGVLASAAAVLAERSHAWWMNGASRGD